MDPTILHERWCCIWARFGFPLIFGVLYWSRPPLEMIMSDLLHMVMTLMVRESTHGLLSRLIGGLNLVSAVRQAGERREVGAEAPARLC